MACPSYSSGLGGKRSARKFQAIERIHQVVVGRGLEEVLLEVEGGSGENSVVDGCCELDREN